MKNNTKRPVIPCLVMLLLLGCEESEGFWIEESCSEYQDEIYIAIELFNNIENEPVHINGIKRHKFVSKQKSLNDDYDLIYCRPPYRTDRSGEAHLNYGDIYLFPDILIDVEYLRCTVLHELGHRILGLGHSDNRTKIMYPLNTADCATKTDWL